MDRPGEEERGGLDREGEVGEREGDKLESRGGQRRRHGRHVDGARVGDHLQSRAWHGMAEQSRAELCCGLSRADQGRTSRRPHAMLCSALLCYALLRYAKGDLLEETLKYARNLAATVPAAALAVIKQQTCPSLTRAGLA